MTNEFQTVITNIIFLPLMHRL